MNIDNLQKHAIEIRTAYDKNNLKKNRKKWTNPNFVQGLVRDVSDLQKIMMAKEGLRDMENTDEKLTMYCFMAIFCLKNLASKKTKTALLKAG